MIYARVMKVFHISKYLIQKMNVLLQKLTSLYSCNNISKNYKGLWFLCTCNQFPVFLLLFQKDFPTTNLQVTAKTISYHSGVYLE